MEILRFHPIAIKLTEADAKNILSADPDSTKIPERVQLLRTGKFQTRLGEVEVTAAMLESMVRNFDERVRGVDLSIDYKHDSQGIAAAWIKGLELSEDHTELWATVDWTPKGLKTLAEKEFRYLSADFAEKYQDNETNQIFGATLFGAGLTNRPIIKGMEPTLTLHEINEGNKMATEKTKEEKALEAKVTTLSEEIKTLTATNTKLAEDAAKLQELQLTPEQMVAKIAALEAELAKLKGEKDSMAEHKELAEKKGEFDKMLSEDKACEAQREAYVAGDMAKFVELAEKMNTGAAGSGGTPKKDGKDEDAADKVWTLAEEKAKKSGLRADEEVSNVLSENPELEKKYNEENSVY